MHSVKNTEESMMKEVDGSQGQVSSKRKTFNSSADYFAELPLTWGKKRLTPKRKKIIEDFFSWTYAKEEVKQYYGAITSDNQPVLELIKDSLNRSTSANPYSMVTRLDIRDWIVKYPRFFKEAEAKGREEYKLRKESKAGSSIQETASIAASTAKEPMKMEVDSQTEEEANLSPVTALPPLSEDEKSALVGLLSGVETPQSGHLLQSPVGFQLVTWISHVLAAATQNAVKGSPIISTSLKPFEPILIEAKKTMENIKAVFQSVNEDLLKEDVGNEQVQENNHD